MLGWNIGWCFLLWSPDYFHLESTLACKLYTSNY